VGFLFAEKTTDFWFSFLSLSLSLSLYFYLSLLLLFHGTFCRQYPRDSTPPNSSTSFDLVRIFFVPPLFSSARRKLFTYFIFCTNVSRGRSHHHEINRTLVLRGRSFSDLSPLLIASILSGYSLFPHTRCSRFLPGTPGSREMILYFLVGGS